MKKIVVALSAMVLMSGALVQAAVGRVNEIAKKDAITEADCVEVAGIEQASGGQADQGSTSGLLATDRDKLCSRCDTVFAKEGQEQICRKRHMPVSRKVK